MVPASRIIDEAKLHNVDMIGLSGLITPSLEEMTHVAQELQRENFTIPVLIRWCYDIKDAHSCQNF